MSAAPPPSSPDRSPRPVAGADAAFPVAMAGVLSDAVLVVDDNRAITYANNAARRLLRLREPIDGLVVDDVLEGTARADFDAAVSRAVADGSWSGALVVHSPVIGAVPTRSTLRPLPGADGSIGWVARDVTTEQAVIASLRERAFYDRATGLPHRSLFLDRLDTLLRDTTSTAPLSVIALAPDRFQAKVSRWSSARGPSGLRHIASRLPTVVPDSASVHRWADEYFVVLLERSGPEEARAVAESLRDSFLEPVPVGDGSVFFTTSIGIASTTPGAIGTDEFLRRAEAAQQQARRTDGSAICVFDEALEARIERESKLEDALGGAAARGEFTLYYQPEIDLRSGRLVACEALLRWNHPEWGSVSPAEFIPVAEASDTIIEIGTWVLRSALVQAAAWRVQFPDRRDFSIAVNISGRQFGDEQFVGIVTDLLAETKVDPGSLCLEITETLLLDDVEDTVQKLQELRRLGLRVAIDDFGTGYSSLSYLRRFPVDVLKVDRTFVSGLGHDAEDSAIVQAVVHMGQALQLVTVAEGVETAHHVIELRELNCDIAQGYHYSPPVRAEEFESFLAAGDIWTGGGR